MRAESARVQGRGEGLAALGGPAVVVAEEPAEPLAAFDLARASADLLARLDDPVVQALVVPLAVIVGQEFPRRVAQRVLAEEDHPAETLFFERTL